MPIDISETQDEVTKPNRKIIEKIELPYEEGLVVPPGINIQITEAPHRDGLQDHMFYEAWIQWPGGTLRTSTAIHDPGMREEVIDFLTAITEVDCSDTIEDLFDKYDWRK
tara:strand:- start:1155 stop:1484 length:330 start_codon:yes stop_codon:yes gene_type:complete